VVAITGDGGFMFGVQELSTAVQFGIGVKRWFQQQRLPPRRRDQRQPFDGRVVASTVNPDFVKLAGSFGVGAARVTSPDHFRPAGKGTGRWRAVRFGGCRRIQSRRGRSFIRQEYTCLAVCAASGRRDHEQASAGDGQHATGAVQQRRNSGSFAGRRQPPPSAKVASASAENTSPTTLPSAPVSPIASAAETAPSASAPRRRRRRRRDPC
jgi:hypothetical protein